MTTQCSDSKLALTPDFFFNGALIYNPVLCPSSNFVFISAHLASKREL
ncbi:hypothetical protein QWZ13_00985 [Reinekea marina]|nr:hypothetical protein [Reinekea marina]MDN3647477.1 hypothetical protein [Reinekea marina]